MTPDLKLFLTITNMFRDGSLVASIILIQASLWFAPVSSQVGNGNVFTFEVNEDATYGSLIGNIRTLMSPKPSSEVTFNLGDNPYFKLDPSGSLTVKGTLDRDSDRDLCTEADYPRVCRWSGVVMLSDSRLISLSVVINDINDNTPKWNFPPTISIPENSPINKTAEFPLATDRDSGQHGIVRYAIQSPTRYFLMENYDGPNGKMARLIIRENLDREVKSWHNLTVIAVDGSDPLHTGSTMLSVKIIDENDNAPVFSSKAYSTTIDESQSIGSSIKMIPSALDKDEGLFSKIRYKFSLSTPEDVREDLAIDQGTGQIRVLKELDYSRKNQYKFQVVAEDGGSPPKTAESTVTITVRDINNNAPVITVNPPRKVIVYENEDPGVEVAVLTVQDKDTGTNGEFDCRLSSEEEFKLSYRGLFNKQMSVFRLVSQKTFDRERQSVTRATVRCTDNGTPAQTGTRAINIYIGDKNDNYPIFQPKTYDFQTTEGNEIGSQVGRVYAKDADTGNNSLLHYEIVWPPGETDTPFEMNSRGEILATKRLDRESRPHGYEFTVTVRDSGTPPRSDSVPVKIALLDINDCTPRFLKNEYTFPVEEDRGKNFTASKSVGKVMATDCDTGRNKRIEYRIESRDKHPFKISSTGQIRTVGNLDRELKDRYILSVVAEDQIPNPALRLSSTVKVFINVKDINDNSPVFIFPNMTNNKVRVSFKEERNFLVARVQAQDRDVGRNGQIRYLIAKGNLYQFFHLREDTGELFIGEPIKEIHVGDYFLKISAVDNGDPIRSVSTELKVTVDKSAPRGPGVAETGDGVETNKLIIIGIVVATAIISAVLITAISIMARRTCRACPEHDDLDMTPNKEGPVPKPLFPQMPGTLVEMDTLLYPPGTTFPMTEHSCDYPVQTTLSSAINPHSSNLETFLGRNSNKLTVEEPFLDSDGDSGRGGSLSNVKLGQYHLYHPHNCINMNSISNPYNAIQYGGGPGQLNGQEHRAELWGTLQRNGPAKSMLVGPADHLHPSGRPAMTTTTISSGGNNYTSLPRRPPQGAHQPVIYETTPTSIV